MNLRIMNTKTYCYFRPTLEIQPYKSKHYNTEIISKILDNSKELLIGSATIKK